MIVLGGALEEIGPRFGGVGLPILLSVTVFLAARESTLFGILAAVAAGAIEEALVGALPMTALAFFVICALVVNRLELPFWGVLFIYPAYVVWMALMCPGLEAGVFGRFLVSVPVGFATTAGVSGILQVIYGRAGLHAE